jgi:hypothetical protein
MNATRAVRTLTLTAFALLATALPASAQAQGGGVLDILGDLLRGGERLRGHVVAVQGTEIIVRAQDGRTYAIDASRADRAGLQALAAGQPVSVAVQGDRGEQQRLVATGVQAESGPRKTFQTVAGTVVSGPGSTAGSRLTFRTREGFTVPLDPAAMVGARLDTSAPSTLYYEYEQAPGSNLTAVWVDTRETATGTLGAPAGPSADPSASVGTPPGPTGDYRRVHGYVESIGIGSLTLKTDEGRSLVVDLSQVSDSMRRRVRPGDLVSVIGRMGREDATFQAEVIQPDAEATGRAPGRRRR